MASDPVPPGATPRARPDPSALPDTPAARAARTLPLDAAGRATVVPGVVDVCVLRRVPAGAGRRRVAPAGEGRTWEVLALERATGTRCPGAWELVHGRIERGERPHEAAVREVREETALPLAALYSITIHPFYAPALGGIHLAVAFAAVVTDDAPAPRLGAEHARGAWLSPAAARRRLAWPREHELLAHALHLLRTGDAGAVEDVLRMPIAG